ncbi:MAG: hypothetical protein PHX61_13380 [Alphaproteobacteria bacterium]|nr:hypothetical protein [Alphaproteobacteria bacterium]
MKDLSPLPLTYCFQYIDIELVAFKDPFISTLHNGPIESHVFSTLQKFGQVAPLLVQQQPENQYHLLADYPQYSALKALAIERVACQILPFTTPPWTLYAFLAFHHLSATNTSPILQAHLLRKAQQDFSENEQLQLLSLMGYKAQKYKLDELLGFLQLDISAILALHQGLLSPKTGKQLARITHEDQRKLVNVITAYKLGGSKQQKLIEMVLELLLRGESCDVAEILNSWLPIQERFVDNLPQKAQGLMQYLHERCYPARTAAEIQFKKFVQGLQPEEKVTIEHSLSFEDESLEVRLRFADAATLGKNWKKIQMIMQ